MFSPCFAFRNTSAEEQIEKIKAELQEVEAAYKAYAESSEDIREDKWVELLVEIGDVQVACETLMYILDTNTPTRDAVRQLVYEKNNARGYYDECP